MDVTSISIPLLAPLLQHVAGGPALVLVAVVALRGDNRTVAHHEGDVVYVLPVVYGHLPEGAAASAEVELLPHVLLDGALELLDLPVAYELLLAPQRREQGV